MTRVITTKAMKKLVTSIIFCFLPMLASAELCESYSEELTGSSGTLKLSGDICLQDNSYSGPVTGTINVSYDQYSADGSIQIDGQLILSYESDSVSPEATTLTLTYSGGPVTYTVGEQTYEVVYQNLIYTFDGDMQQTSESGNILLNGETHEAKDTPYSYIKLF